MPYTRAMHILPALIATFCLLSPQDGKPAPPATGTQPAKTVTQAPDARQSGSPVSASPAPIPSPWRKLDAEPFRGKQDDIFFVTSETGWYVNGGGNIYKTTDGGTTWKKQFAKPGTFFRCVGFIDEKHGFAGNIGTDYFPNVSDTTPLYETTDGGETWQPAANVPAIKGLCAIHVEKTMFINAGEPGYKTTIWVGGRVGGPANLLRSDDESKTWETVTLPANCAMILDVYFRDKNTGFVCAATDADVAKSHALILKTTDGGKTWKSVYESKRPYELTWKGAFPSEKIGYVTVQSYDPDPANTKRYVAKTTDGGETWTEQLLTDDKTCREFGIGFASDTVGYVGGTTTGYQTLDGGAVWTKVVMGQAVNKIRFVKTPDGKTVGYAIGVQLHKLDALPQ
ncbi:MAG: hypothetical protein H7145_25265 [Akkermansiaceae bacterium]|nr:hypothetical protein [Armatimonadota bacterium]